MKDLIILAADQSMKLMLEAVLDRHRALGIREIPRVQRDIKADARRDPAVYLNGHEFLRSQSKLYRYGILICDRHGSGQHEASRMEMESHMEANMDQSGWLGRSAAIVIDPELEIWAWSRSPHVASALGWEANMETEQWLLNNGYLLDANGKPERPQAALDLALRGNRIPKSSSVFVEIAQNVSLRRCHDPAFLKLQRVLREWFPAR